MAHPLVLIGTGTGVGKTYVAERLLRALAAEGRAALGYKPVESGVAQATGRDGHLAPGSGIDVSRETPPGVVHLPRAGVAPPRGAPRRKDRGSRPPSQRGPASAERSRRSGDRASRGRILAAHRRAHGSRVRAQHRGARVAARRVGSARSPPRRRRDRSRVRRHGTPARRGHPECARNCGCLDRAERGRVGPRELGPGSRPALQACPRAHPSPGARPCPCARPSTHPLSADPPPLERDTRVGDRRGERLVVRDDNHGCPP